MRTIHIEHMTRNWKLLFKVKNGHKYFQLDDGRIGVADDSGSNPDQTDDGALYLDKSRAITMGWDKGSTAFVPLIDKEGKPTSTSEPCGGALRVAKEFGMRIITDEGFAFEAWAEVKPVVGFTSWQADSDAKPQVGGSWPEFCTQRAFVEGATWARFEITGSTAFGSERREAEQEAIKRYGEP